MINLGSRYEKEEVFYTLDSRSGTTRPTVMRSRPLPQQRADRQAIKWQTGARVDRVSKRIFGAPDRWWILMDGNPEILDPMSINPGTTVVIP